LTNGHLAGCHWAGCHLADSQRHLLTTEWNSLWHPCPVVAADPPGRAEQLESPVTGVPGDGARLDRVLTELDGAVSRSAREPASRRLVV